jgi:hypothetical protein
MGHVANQRLLAAGFRADFVDDLEEFHFRIGARREALPTHAFGEADGVAVVTALDGVGRVSGCPRALGTGPSRIAEQIVHDELQLVGDGIQGPDGRHHPATLDLGDQARRHPDVPG